MKIISHITLGTNNKRRSAAFDDAVFGAIGFVRLSKPPEKPLAYERTAKCRQSIVIRRRMVALRRGKRTHIAFIAEFREQVHAFHPHDLFLRWQNEGKPGLHLHYGPNYYAAYVRAPDGNKLQAVCDANG